VLDLLGPVTLLTSFLHQSLSTMGPAAIPVWDQYVDFMEWALNSLADLFNNGGLAIIAFTIIVKTILLPLTVKSIRSSKNMQELAPRIKELQKKYGADRQRVSQETMALYQQYGVNPLAGCLPMIIQIPIFFGLYRAIMNLGDSGGHWDDAFMWIPNLSEADPWHVLPIAAGLFQWVQSRMMRPANQKVTDPQQQIMNIMMNFMPLFVVFFGWGFAAGAVLYWATQSVYSVIQQWFITGWGALIEWFPWLPELPEHRRLGYKAPRNLDDLVVVSGQPIEQKGMSGWLNKRMQAAQETANSRQQEMAAQKAAKSGKSAPSSPTNGDVIETTSKTSNRKGTSYQDRVEAASRSKAKAASSSQVAPGADPNPNSKASKKAARQAAQETTPKQVT